MELIQSKDLPLERAILRSPGDILPFLRYIDHASGLAHLVYIYERAVSVFPRSYKLWKRYLTLRISHVKHCNSVKYADEFDNVVRCFERALVLLNKMPRIWLMYLEFLLLRPRITATRRTFDRALQSLPMSQHSRIWELYLPFAKSAGGITARTVWKRYLQTHGDEQEEYITLLMDIKDYQHAAEAYIALLDQPKFKSRNHKSRFQLWLELVELLVDYPDEIIGIDVDRIISSGIKRFTDQAGKLYTSLATYHISKGAFDLARDVFEQGITTVSTARDFTHIFDSYAEFEESLLSSLVEDGDDIEVDMAMLRFESILNRRPFLMSDVLLRQNPHNVSEWINRTGLWGDNDQKINETYRSAIRAIHPRRASGKLSTLFFSFAAYHESKENLDMARKILHQATEVNYRTVDELADVWIHFTEFELRHNEFDQAVDLLKRATSSSKYSTVNYKDHSISAQSRLHKSVKLWAFYLDLVESVSTLEEARKTYERLFDLKIITPQTLVNYATLLEENNYFEDCFKVYERGIAIFPFPIAFEFWNLYLIKAIAREVAIERLRDLFEQAVSSCPPELSSPIWILYADLEIKRGLLRNAVSVYERAEASVDISKREELFYIHATTVAKHFGKAALRAVYQSAIQKLPEIAACRFALLFSTLELSLGEVDRARAVFVYASQFADPRLNPNYWEEWQKFEVKYGSEDTYREMLRVKRSVEMSKSTDAVYLAQIANQESKNATINFVRGSRENGSEGQINPLRFETGKTQTELNDVKVEEG